MTKDNYNFSREELQDLMVMESVITGYLYRTYNRMPVTNYNKIATSLGLDKRNKESLLDLLAVIAEDKDLTKWHMLAIEGSIGVEDLENYNSFSNEVPVKTIGQEGIHNVIAPYIVANEEVLANNREFRDIQKSGAHVERLFTGLKHYMHKEFVEKKLNEPQYIVLKQPTGNSNKELIVGLSDWHVGAKVDNIDTGGYSFDILKRRLNQFVTETIEAINLYDIQHVHMYFVGDLIEHINMRNVNQAFEAEFPATEQISKGKRLIYDTISAIASQVPYLTFGAVGGNHDRFQGNKADKIYNDNVAYLLVDELLMLQELGALPKNVDIIDNRSDVYSFVDRVAGKNVKVTHGDTEAKKDDVKIRKHIRREDIDYLIMGHVHTSRIVQEDYSRYQVYIGSTMGANNYSTENNFPTTIPSQLLMVLDTEKDAPIFNPVMLD